MLKKKLTEKLGLGLNREQARQARGILERAVDPAAYYRSQHIHKKDNLPLFLSPRNPRQSFDKEEVLPTSKGTYIESQSPSDNTIFKAPFSPIEGEPNRGWNEDGTDTSAPFFSDKKMEGRFSSGFGSASNQVNGLKGILHQGPNSRANVGEKERQKHKEEGHPSHQKFEKEGKNELSDSVLVFGGNQIKNEPNGVLKTRENKKLKLKASKPEKGNFENYPGNITGGGYLFSDGYNPSPIEPKKKEANHQKDKKDLKQTKNQEPKNSHQVQTLFHFFLKKNE